MFDVAVIGAGLAGLQTARLLGSRGLRVALIDCKASLCDGIQTTGIFVRKTWEDFPLPPEQLGPGIREVVLYSPSLRPLQLTAPRDEFRVGRMSWIYLYLLEQCSRLGVTWMPSTRLLECDPLHGHSRLTIERGGHRERVPVRYVVGADGPRSKIAAALSLDRNREFLVGVEDVIEPPKDVPPSLHCFLDPRLAPGYIGWVVTDGQEAHAGVAGYGDLYDPRSGLERFRKRVPHLVQGRVLERRGGLIPVNGILRRIANRNGLLTGDAAGAVSPLTAGGLDPAMRLSTLAADVIARYLDGGDARVLREYNGDRFRTRFIARRWMRRTIRAVQQPAVLELGCALLRTPPFRALAAHVFFGRRSFPDVQGAAVALPHESAVP